MQRDDETVINIYFQIAVSYHEKSKLRTIIKTKPYHPALQPQIQMIRDSIIAWLYIHLSVGSTISAKLSSPSRLHYDVFFVSNA